MVSSSPNGAPWSTPQALVEQGQAVSLVNFEDSLYLVYADSDSTGQLHMLPCFHLAPINLIVFQGFRREI